jgi:hypothetical protein
VDCFEKREKHFALQRLKHEIVGKKIIDAFNNPACKNQPKSGGPRLHKLITD